MLCCAALLLVSCQLTRVLAVGLAGRQPAGIESTQESAQTAENTRTPEPAAGVSVPTETSGAADSSGSAEATRAVETSAPAEADPSASMVLSERTSQETSESPEFHIEARWPYLEWGSDPRAAAFNQAAETLAADEIRAFKQGVSDLPAEPVFQESSSFFSMDFVPTSSENGILAVLFQITFYSAGAAHPGHYSVALNYDLRSGEEIHLEDLFEPGAGYLEALSEYCISDLTSRGVLAWEEGALPESNNYRVWNITPDGLRITFDEYQVASYAAGPQTVLVPYSALDALLRAGGPLSDYLQAQ